MPRPRASLRPAGGRVLLSRQRSAGGKERGPRRRTQAPPPRDRPPKTPRRRGAASASRLSGPSSAMPGREKGLRLGRTRPFGLPCLPSICTLLFCLNITILWLCRIYTNTSESGSAFSLSPAQSLDCLFLSQGRLWGHHSKSCRQTAAASDLPPAATTERGPPANVHGWLEAGLSGSPRPGPMEGGHGWAGASCCWTSREGTCGHVGFPGAFTNAGVMTCR